MDASQDRADTPPKFDPSSIVIIASPALREDEDADSVIGTICGRPMVPEPEPLPGISAPATLMSREEFEGILNDMIRRRDPAYTAIDRQEVMESYLPTAREMGTFWYLIRSKLNQDTVNNLPSIKGWPQWTVEQCFFKFCAAPTDGADEVL